MASVTYGKCIMANVIMEKIFIAKILWQMKLSRLSYTTLYFILHTPFVYPTQTLSLLHAPLVYPAHTLCLSYTTL